MKNQRIPQEQNASLPLRLLGALAEGLDFPTHAIQSLGSLLPNIIPGINPELRNKLNEAANDPRFANQSPARDLLAAAAGVSPEQFEPQSTLESYGQRVLRQSPLAALTGGTSALASNAIGAIPAEAGAYFGADPFTQSLLQLGGELGHGIYKGNFKSHDFQSKQAQYYTKAEQHAHAPIPPRAAKIQEAIHKIDTALLTQTDDSIKSVVREARDTINNVLQGKSIKRMDPNKALDLRKNLNAQLSGLYKEGGETGKSIAKYLNPLKESINDFFAQYSIDNPTFFQHLTYADKLTELQNMNSKITNFLSDKIPSKYANKAIKSILEPTVGSVEKIVRRLGHTVGREHYFGMVKSALANKPAPFLRSLREFEREYLKPEQSFKFEQPKKKTLEIEFVE